MGMSLGILVEGAVTILLAMTLGYCFILNERLKKLHADRESLKTMVSDLINATNLANGAIKELKQTAVEADTTLATRLEEAERFGVQLANHITAGASIMDRIAKITSVARHSQALDPAPVVPPVVSEQNNRLQAALDELAARQRIRGRAA